MFPGFFRPSVGKTLAHGVRILQTVRDPGPRSHFLTKTSLTGEETEAGEGHELAGMDSCLPPRRRQAASGKGHNSW